MLQDSRYRAAFQAYLRKGTPIARSLKEARETERYVWRTQHDGKVRPGHARNDGQIAGEARQSPIGPFDYDFDGVYNFGDVEFSHGHSEVSGLFIGSSEALGDMLAIRGTCNFYFHDWFRDPIGFNVELGGAPYEITGEWSATFEAQVFRQEALSDYFHKKAE